MKKLLTFILTITIITISITNSFYIVTVNASENNIPSWLNPIITMAEGIEDGAQISADMLKDSLFGGLSGVGFIANGVGYTTSALLDYLRGYNNGQFSSNNESDAQVINNVADYFINNSQLTDNSITYNNNSRSLLNGLASNIIDSNGFWYCYTAEWHDSVTTYPNGTMYNRLADIIHNAQIENYCIVRSGENVLWCVTIPKDNDIKFVANGQSQTAVNAEMYSGTSWNKLNNNTIPDGYHIYKIANENGTVNTYDGTDWNLIDGYWNYFIIGSMLFDTRTKVANSGNWGGIGGSGYYMGYSNTYCYLVYKNIESMKLGQQGEQGYYQSSNWQNFSKSNSDNYTVDSSNSNNVTYGDVTNYITNNTTDGNPPSPTQIQVYIDNNNPSGGGNGGGSGGGNGGGSGLGDVLGTLGSLIGSLISGIGQFLIGIFQGLVNAINSLLSLIGDAIGGIVESIPSAFNDFMTAVLGWLPPEWTAIISASLLIMVIVGIIKLIRG